MKHKVVGIELGAYKVRVLVASAGFRSATITEYYERPVPEEPQDQPHEERAARIVCEIFREAALDQELHFVAMPGDGLSMRLLEFEFSGIKRADLEKAVGAELESELPHDLEELVYDFDTIPRPKRAGAKKQPEVTAPLADGIPIEEFETGTHVLAVATTHDKVARFLKLLQRHGVDARAVLAAPTAYARAVSQLEALWGVKDEPVVVIDHGHARTNVCLVKEGRLIYARTLSRGGRHLTQAIARAWKVPFAEAERAKHEGGYIASEAEPGPATMDDPNVQAWVKVSSVITEEIVPLVRDLRQTLSSGRAQTGISPERGVLCGGGGRLKGLASFLAEELGFPIATVTEKDASRLIGDAAALEGVTADSSLLVHGIALEGASGRAQFDLRQGSLAHRADFTFLRAKAKFFAASVMCLIVLIAANSYASLFALRKEETILDRRLGEETTALFGQSVSASEVHATITPKKEQSVFPKMTAFDQLAEISKRLPARDAIRLDVRDLEIDIISGKQKISIRGTADSVKSIDEMEKKLKEVSCFAEVQKGKVQGPEGEKDFTLTIKTKCP